MAEVARDKADDDALSLVKRSGPMRRVGKLQEMLRRSEAARMELERDIMQGEVRLQCWCEGAVVGMTCRGR